MSQGKHQPRKRFGQHFLHDPSIIQRIVSSIRPVAGERLVEIGPGEGAMTELLLAACGRLDVVELDRDLIPRLEARFAGQGELHVHATDALRFDFCQLANGQKLRVVGNLPYNISTPLLFHLFAQIQCIDDMHFMLQKEVVERMVAQAGDAAYGRLSIMLQYYCSAEYLFTVKPGAFNPPPKVDSAVVRLIPHPHPPITVQSFDDFAWLVNHAFSQRRKTLRNILRDRLSVETIQGCNIDPAIRPERLTLAEFACLANAATHAKTVATNPADL